MHDQLTVEEWNMVLVSLQNTRDNYRQAASSPRTMSVDERQSFNTSADRYQTLIDKLKG